MNKTEKDFTFTYNDIEYHADYLIHGGVSLITDSVCIWYKTGDIENYRPHQK